MTEAPDGRVGVLLDGLAAAEAADARAWAAQVDALVELLARAREGDPVGVVEDGLLLDLSGTWRLGQGTAFGRVQDAERLATVLTATLDGLRLGRVWRAQARILLAGTRCCSEIVATEVERRVVDAGALTWCPADLRRRVAREVLAVEAELEPQQTAERGAAAFADRRVVATPQPDGMGSLWAVLSAEQLRAHQLALDELARRQRAADREAGVERTADQRRADLLAMLPALALHALDGPAGSAAPAPAVQLLVHVPVATCLGLSDEPGELAGHGPISAEHVRRLLPDATLRKVAVDAVTGTPLRVASRAVPAGPDPAGLLTSWLTEPAVVDDTPEPSWRPSVGLDRLVRVRDPRCTAPGCSTPAGRCDLDHLEPWHDGGATSAANLGPASRRCHRAKTHHGWTWSRHDDGSHTWTSPTGRTYDRPPAWIPPPVPRPVRAAAHVTPLPA